MTSCLSRRSPLLALLLATACPSTPSQPDSGPLPPAYIIDSGFLFGAGVASYQVEGGDDSADWTQWRQVPLDGGTCTQVLNCDNPDNGPAFVSHAQSDVASLAGLGLNSLRFSLEWERLQPQAPSLDGGGDAGLYDPAALAYYHGLLAACADAGVRPLVTLSQGTLPVWLHGVAPGASGASATDWVGGWRGLAGEDAGPGAALVQAFGKFAGDMEHEFGTQVHLWLTFDAPMANALSAYASGTFPPGGQSRISDLQRAVINLAYANGAAYDAIHAVAADGGMQVLVGSAHQLRTYLPPTSGDPDGGMIATNVAAYVNNWLLPFAFIDGDLDTHFDGNWVHPGDPEGEGVGLAGLAGRCDFLGVNYAGPLQVTPAEIPDAQGNPNIGLHATLSPPASWIGGYTAAPVGDALDPADLASVLLDAANFFSITPLIVTELSLNENAQPDVQRPAYLVQSVQAVQSAMAQGAPVAGIFYRSLIDGFEWQQGFTPRTGLWRVDFTDPARARTPTQGAQAFGQIAKALGVTPTIAGQWIK